MISAWQKQRIRVRVRRTSTRRTLTRYFRSAWRPAAFCLTMLMLLTLIGAMNEMALLSSTYLSMVLGSVCGVGVAIAFMGLVTATVWNLVNKYWIKSALSICLVMGACYALNMTIANLFLFAADDAVLDYGVTTIPPAEVSETIERVNPAIAPFELSEKPKTDELSEKPKTPQKDEPAQDEETVQKKSVDRNESTQEMPAGLVGD